MLALTNIARVHSNVTVVPRNANNPRTASVIQRVCARSVHTLPANVNHLMGRASPSKVAPLTITTATSPFFRSFYPSKSSSLFPFLILGGLIVAMAIPVDDDDTVMMQEKLTNALKDGNIVLVRKLVSEGVDLKRFKGLWIAASNEACLKLLSKHIPELINEEDDEGRTALHLAILHANQYKTEFLLRYGASKRKPINLDKELKKLYNFYENEIIYPTRFAFKLQDYYRDTGDNKKCILMYAVILRLSNQ